MTQLYRGAGAEVRGRGYTGKDNAVRHSGMYRYSPCTSWTKAGGMEFVVSLGYVMKLGCRIPKNLNQHQKTTVNKGDAMR